MNIIKKIILNCKKMIIIQYLKVFFKKFLINMLLIDLIVYVFWLARMYLFNGFK